MFLEATQGDPVSQTCYLIGSALISDSGRAIPMPFCCLDWSPHTVRCLKGFYRQQEHSEKNKTKHRAGILINNCWELIAGGIFKTVNSQARLGLVNRMIYQAGTAFKMSLPFHSPFVVYCET